jgi:uncharacterized repeat protein (TIGR01451 family)
MVSVKHRICAALAVLAVAAAAEAKPRIVISIQQTKEVTESAPTGKVTRFVPATSVSPGDVLEYVLVYTNEGDEPATNAVIEDPVPKGTRFLANSASGEGAEITFSNDNGKSFAPAVKLTYEIKTPSGAVERRVVTPSDYTNIRWTVARVPAGASGKVSFRVRVN